MFVVERAWAWGGLEGGSLEFASLLCLLSSVLLNCPCLFSGMFCTSHSSPYNCRYTVPSYQISTRERGRS